MGLAQFFSMGGYGFYVWSAWGISVLLLCLMWWMPFKKQKKLKQQLRKQIQRQQMQQDNL